jgi:hypothetical protein
MANIILYGVAPLVIFAAGYTIGFFIGKLKYNPNIPEPNYLGGHPREDSNVYRLD